MIVVRPRFNTITRFQNLLEMAVDGKDKSSKSSKGTEKVQDDQDLLNNINTPPEPSPPGAVTLDEVKKLLTKELSKKLEKSEKKQAELNKQMDDHRKESSGKINQISTDIAKLTSLLINKVTLASNDVKLETVNDCVTAEDQNYDLAEDDEMDQEDESSLVDGLQSYKISRYAIGKLRPSLQLKPAF